VISVSCLVCCSKSDRPLEVLGEIHKGKIVSVEQGFHLDALKKCNVVIKGEDEYSICVIVPPSVWVEERNEIYFYEVPVKYLCGEIMKSSKIGFFIPQHQARELGY
jgi:hypothetical protein